MLKDASQQQKFAMLRSWMPSIIEVIKKDLKNEHLRGDAAFRKKYFATRDLNKLSTQELAEAYSDAIGAGDADPIAEFIINRWLIKNSEIYNYFEGQLQTIAKEFTELTEIEASKATQIVEGATAQFGAPRTYQFAVLNSVVFPKSVFDQLGARAEKDAKAFQEELSEKRAKELAIKDQRQFEMEISRLEDKYEKKLIGLQKKYIDDTTALKKQIAALQRRLEAS
jgi:hypothetical protein